MHFLYVIYSEKFDVYYKGETSDLVKRLQTHNNDQSEYTKGKGPWELVYIEEYDTRTEALKREKIVKKLNRRSIEKLIRDWKAG